MRVSVGLKCKASTDNFLPFSVERERGRASSLGLGKGIIEKHRGSATDRGHSLGDPLMGHHDRLWPCAGSQYWPTPPESLELVLIGLVLANCRRAVRRIQNASGHEYYKLVVWTY